MSASALQVRIQNTAIDVAAEDAALLGRSGDGAGARVSFVGLVRADPDGGVRGLTLEHYPGMTERALGDILAAAAARWPLLAAGVVHRIGPMQLGENIVWVGVTAAHRQAAFMAVEFIMDLLKTEAPFWKKAVGAAGEHWVSARASDEQARQRWAQAGSATLPTAVSPDDKGR